MTKSGEIILIVSAVCLFSLFGVIQAEAEAPTQTQTQFHVEGKVYCDFCRALFENRLSKPMPDAEVRLQCRNQTDDTVTLTVEGQTDERGVYSLLVERDHEDEICEMILMKSSMDDCTEIPNEGHAKESARITITNNNGMSETTRHANPLFFLKKEASPECDEVFKELELLPEEINKS
ncbi:pollen allergen Sal k 5.0101-like [Lycium ferocissimum]|uniref:pollen allergen Sal k 5.0101-like n=1 Tax=Lycium ferocissimum TaxID=112874 RepID=UPI0028164058|nr:pollen allergen Sal k 5.0101-like [Lycium ferocissimum]